MLLLTAACGADQNSDPGSGDREDPGSITLYYVDETWTGFNPQSMDIDQVASVENVIDTVMIALIEGGDSDTAVAPVAPGMTYQRYTYDGAKTINLIFNVDWESTDAYAVLLSKAAFVRTICQITPLDKVVFELVDMSNESNVIKEEPLVNTLMTKSSTERVKAIINPVIIPELMEGRTTLKNAETGVQPRSLAASERWGSIRPSTG